MEWYQKSVEAIEQELSTDRNQGLREETARARFESVGPNRLSESKKKPFFQKLIDQFKDPLVIILIVASVLSMFTGDLVEAVMIIAIVILNAALSIYQEGKAEDSVAALQKMSSPSAKIIRQGKLTTVKSEQLVPGDVVLLETGDIVPADLRLFESSNLQIDEASFTGESVAAEKEAKTRFDREVGIGDRTNYAYSSTIVTYGHGKGLVTDTGHATEIGKIATTIESYEEEETPLQKKLAVLSGQLGKLILAIAVFVGILGFLAKNEVMDILMTSISLAVAAIPEGMTAVVTIVLSIGMNAMAERNAIVKKLLSVETLGTTTVICSDKTGTLTQNEMTVTKLYTNQQSYTLTGTGYDYKGDILLDGKQRRLEEDPNLKRMLQVAALVNDARISEKEGQVVCVGDPTEGALLTMAAKGGLDPDALRARFPRLAELPFDSSRKMMTTFHEGILPDQVTSFTKGAPDLIVKHCDRILLDGRVESLTDERKEALLSMNNQLASQALRCLAYAYRTFDQLPEKADQKPEVVERGMIFVGLSGMIDPPRPEVKEAIRQTKSAGITTIMITGDYLETAFAIGKDLGIAEDRSQAMMGEALNGLALEEVQEIVKTIRIFARVSPENKVQIVEALKANGEITAMTGDGVNDAPAIKRADIGISMGITGTDVAKNTAEVILTDDNFATIVGAVEEGRTIYANIKKFISFLLSCNVGEVLVISVAMIIEIILLFSHSGADFPTPLSPIMLLWLNLVTDSLPALALGMEKAEPGIMEIPPRNPKEPIIDRAMKRSIVVQAIAIAVATLSAFAIGYFYFGAAAEGAAKLAEGRTMAFSTLILAELFRAMAARSEEYTLGQIGWFSNRAMNGAILVGVFLLLIVLYVPFLAGLFDVAFMTWKEWIPTLVLSLIPFLATEGYEAIKR